MDLNGDVIGFFDGPIQTDPLIEFYSELRGYVTEIDRHRYLVTSSHQNIVFELDCRKIERVSNKCDTTIVYQGLDDKAATIFADIL